VQLPASAPSSSGLQNVSGSVSSGTVRALAGGATAKQQSAPFAVILAEQSLSVSALKNGGALPDKEDSSIGALLQGGAMNPNDALIAKLQQPKIIEGVFNDLLSDGATPAKDKTELTQHRKTAPTSSDDSGKKRQATAASDPALLSAVMAPVVLVAAPPTPAVTERGPHSTAKTLLNHPLTPQVTSTAHDQKLEAQASGPAADSEFAKREETISLEGDSLLHDVGPSPIPSAKSQPMPSPTVVAKVVQAGSQVVQLHNPAQKLQGVSPLADSAHGINGATVSHAEPVAQSTVAQSAIGATQKPKLQNKTSDDAVRKLTRISGSGAAPAADMASSSGNSLTLAPSAHAVTGDLSAKPANALTEASAFQRLDAGEYPATLLNSSPHQVAVGVHDPSLGWVEVQTQSSAGHISATLTTASLEAHASLAVQAPSITQYLADRNVSVLSVNVHTQMGAQNGGPGGGQPQSGSGGAYHGPHELRNVGARSSRPLPNEAGNGIMPQALNASRISVRA